jgi:hypothetical protein
MGHHLPKVERFWADLSISIKERQNAERHWSFNMKNCNKQTTAQDEKLCIEAEKRQNAYQKVFYAKMLTEAKENRKNGGSFQMDDFEMPPYPDGFGWYEDRMIIEKETRFVPTGYFAVYSYGSRWDEETFVDEEDAIAHYQDNVYTDIVAEKALELGRDLKDDEYEELIEGYDLNVLAVTDKQERWVYPDYDNNEVYDGWKSVEVE